MVSMIDQNEVRGRRKKRLRTGSRRTGKRKKKDEGQNRKQKEQDAQERGGQSL